VAHLLDPNSPEAQAFANDQRNTRKIREAARKLKIDLMNPLRPGKRLLVLDLDYSEQYSPVYFFS